MIVHLNTTITDPNSSYYEIYEKWKENQIDKKSTNNINEFSQVKMLPKSIDEYRERFKEAVFSKMDKLGIILDEGELLKIWIGEDSLICVDGLKEEEKEIALEKELNTIKTNTETSKIMTKNMYATSFYIHSDYAKSAETFTESQSRANLIKLKFTANDMIQKMTGVEIDFSTMQRTNEKITGYPKELEWIFSGDFHSHEDKRKYATATSILHITNLLLNAGYERIPDVADLGVIFEFTSRDFIQKE